MKAHDNRVHLSDLGGELSDIRFAEGMLPQLSEGTQHINDAV